MAKMIRKQIYMTEAQDGVLKAKARDLKVTEAEVVREALEVYQTYGGADMILDSSAWLQEREFLRQRLAAGSKDKKPAEWTWRRENLYER
jgi:hypothetical protein